MMGLGGRSVPLLWLLAGCKNNQTAPTSVPSTTNSNSLCRLLISFIATDINNKEPKGGGGGYMVLATSGPPAKTRLRLGHMSIT